MVEQAELIRGILVGLGWGKHLKAWEGKAARLLPQVYLTFRLWCEEEGRLLWIRLGFGV